MAPSTKRTFTVRHFYRCCDCLSVVALLEPIPLQWSAQRGHHLVAECGACTGKLESLGATNGGHLRYLNGYESPCDGKCTNALGPSCDCQCGGENHGSGRVVPVFATSGIPRVQTSPEAAAKGKAYRNLVSEYRALWNTRYGGVTNLKRQEGYISPELYSFYMEGQYALQLFSKARAGRTHAGRNKRIEQLMAEPKGNPCNTK